LENTQVETLVGAVCCGAADLAEELERLHANCSAFGAC
jgi:hypothetical protein